ncbi:MAG: hypothetical protein CVU54_18785 [Deltaproteobacteria bacterium HGW-Deltaproteobacteria-12]|jgi:hypothetical protein|nr:MAG: hypothetical protein CVU54_18785 [Deltaproteobacteria bacterium HGW-Deltaproteobacteria-12]
MTYKILHFIVTARNFTRAILTGVLILTTASMALAQSLNPAIRIEPNTRVEVGEEVFFSATGTTYPDAAILSKARYEWDFGDGYAFKYEHPLRNPINNMAFSGLAVTHCFMKPGDFTIKLTVNVFDKFDAAGNPIGGPLATKTTTSVVHVTGEAPMAGFEIQRAPFYNRLAQYLYVQIPPAYRGNQTTLRVTLEGAKGSKTILLSKSSLAGEERVFLDHKPLFQDDYVVIAELLTASGQRIPGGLWRDKFSKRYPSIPKVGIDENNSFRVNGALFFPICPFMTDIGRIKDFAERSHINSLSTQGYYTIYNPSSWHDYLNKAAENGLLAIGPGRGNYEVPKAYWSPAPKNRWQFNHNPDRMSEYVQMNKNHSAMFAWGWQDEPNMGGWGQKVYPPTLAAWAYVSHRDDPHHPALNGFYGSDWTKYYGTKLNMYDYLASAQFFGGKKWMQDIIAFDIYPIAFRLHPSLNVVDMGPYAMYLDALERMHSNNKYLVPIIPAINPGNRNRNETVLIHSAEQVYSEAWMNVIHGVKGICWFPYFDPTTIRWDAMKKFADQMKVLAPVVLGPEPIRTLKDDANTALNRVDTLIREKDGSVYVFAARVTEPDPIEKAKYRGVEPESIKVNFTVSGLTGDAVAEVVDEGRKVSISNGQFTDTFFKNAVHIYKINTVPNKP